MTKLEEEMFDRIFEECRKAAEQNPMFHEHDSASVSAKAAAEVAKRYIDKVLVDYFIAEGEFPFNGDYETTLLQWPDLNEFRKKWLKDNGVI